MHIAIVAPLWESIPPKGYGGIERYLFDLLNELDKKKNLNITVYCTSDSEIPKRFKKIGIATRAIRTDKFIKDPKALYALMFSELLKNIEEYDLIHNHTDFQILPFAKFINVPIVTHLHGPFIPERVKIYEKLGIDTYFVSISKNQQKLLPNLNYIANIYHGTPVEKFESLKKRGEHLVWLGRVSPEKDLKTAIDVARNTGRKLVLAGKIDPVDEEYWEVQVRPFVDGEQIIYIGELGFKDKVNFLKDAYAFLMPLTWDEPFGLVLIEALASGTPVIATGRGSVPEIIEHGKTGFIAKNLTEMVKFVEKIPKIDRKYCVSQAKKKFGVKIMANEHVKMYEKAVNEFKKRKR